MNQVVSAIIGVIATLFGLMLSPGLAPTATAATAQGYTYDSQLHGAASTHTTSERGPPATSDRAINQDADNHGPRGAAARPSGAAARPKAVLTYAYDAYDAYDILARSARVASAGTTTQQQVRRSDNELSPHPSAGVAAKGAGGLRIVGSGFSASERGAAEALAGQGRSVVLREATGVGRTSDLLVDGIPYDVYTPTTGSLDRIVSAIASKGSQVNGGGVVLDLSKSPLTGVDPSALLGRVQGASSNISDIIILGG